jgi:hypothetical protein
MKHRITLTAVLAAIVLCASAFASGRTLRWGFHGHEISGSAAATGLPAALPAFFRFATARMTYLNPEPDRWRGDNARELSEAMRYDHYVDSEVVPADAWAATDRFQYLVALQKAGVANPARDAGLLQFRIIEMYQELVVEWRLWRKEQDPEKKKFIEDRILNDAGVLGHYVTDAANPHHTTVHHNGWAEGYANPRGFKANSGFHSRFESQYVEAHVSAADLVPLMNETPRTITDIRAETLAHINRSHARLERLYELDELEAYGKDTKGAAHREFAIERLAAGANMLRDVWWSAWVQSGVPEPAR